MSNTIDCLFIGHNEMEFEKYEQVIRTMGKQTGAYRDLNLNFSNYKGKKYTIADFYNYFSKPDNIKKFTLGEVVGLAIAYLGTYIHKRGFSFDYVNSFQDEKEELIQILTDNKFRAIVIPTTLYVAPFPILEIISLVRKYCSDAKIILGGPYISTQIQCSESDEVLQYFFNSINADIYVNSSQGEATLVRILKTIRTSSSLQNIPNITYKDVDKYKTNPIDVENNKLDDNAVDWTLFSDRIDKFAMIRTTISCAFSCNFCGFPRHAGKYQVADIRIIEQELQEIDSFGTVTSLQFIDDTFNIPQDRFKKILKMMIKNKFKFKWHSHFRCQFADREIVELMKESGCEGVYLGIESGSQKILDNMNKATTVDKYIYGLKLLNEYDIISHANFIIGFPGETGQTVQESINFIEENKPTFFRTQLWYFDPFTPIYKERDWYKIKGKQFNWSHNSMDVQEACDWIDKIFMTVKNSIWIPQYNFEFRGIFSLIHRGMNLNQAMDFINTFNTAVREKLKLVNNGETRPELVKKLSL